MREIQKINRILNKYLADFGYKIHYGSDFCCNVTTEEIYWTLYTPINADKWFMEFARKNGLKYECGTFILALFHEIGHLETYDKLSEKVLDYCDEQKELIVGDYAETKEGNMHYFNLPIERRATKWAIRFINTFPEFCKEINDDVAKLVRQIPN